MSATSTRNPVAPVEYRDLRSAALPFKHDKDQREKWSNGQRPSAGVRIDWNDELLSGNEGQKAKVRPHKQWSQISDHKSHANKNPKPFGTYDRARLAHKAAAVVDANDHTNSALSRSLLELLPQHANNTNSAIQVALRESVADMDAEILYSFDNKGPSPGDKGRKVDLGGLVEQAEKKWASEQTDRIVKGEYEVLDNEGETTVLNRGKGKKSPKQKAAKHEQAVTKLVEDDGFELL